MHSLIRGVYFSITLKTIHRKDTYMKQPKLELLSPAGSWEALEAAVRSGADAVYLGGSLFSARANAQNFDHDTLKQAVAYCHARGVKVHLAVNTILLNHEIEPALDFVAFAYTLPVDAVIVQDTGLLHLLRQAAPTLQIHASTQMSVHTPEGAKLLAAQGVSRVVLARELSLREIKEISLALKDGGFAHVEIEHFVHGALCMSVSGQCYFSSLLGSRSGNRGQCAQTCRLPFSAKGGTGYDLSLKDLSMIERIGELADAGVTSFKIEGRMKRPEYVAAATAACRFALDQQAIPQNLTENLEAVFSRSGFTTGYPDGTLGRDMFGIRTKEDVTSATNTVFQQLHSYYQKERQSVPITYSLVIKRSTPVTVMVSDHEQHTVTVKGDIPQQAIHRPIDEARCLEQLKKTGGTPFYCTNVTCSIDPDLSIPVSLLNQLRREALEQLLKQREQAPVIPFHPVSFPTKTSWQSTEPLPLRAVFTRLHSADDIPDCANVCQMIYIPINTKEHIVKELQNRGLPLAVTMPRGMFGTERTIASKLEQFLKWDISHVWVGTVNSVALAKTMDCNIHGGYSLNVTNTAAFEWYEQLGLTDLELSYELTLKQSAKIGGSLPRGLLLYGRLPLMLCRNCPGKNDGKNCKNCNGTTWLTDRKNIKFPVQCDYGCSEVLNAVPLTMSDRISDISGMNFGILRFTVENSVEIEETFQQFLYQKAPLGHYTRGLYEKGIK